MPKAEKEILEEYVKNHGGQRVITKILIANNGMAATKAILSMRRWAFVELGSLDLLHFVAMASENDLEVNADYIRLANTFVQVPGGKNSNNYANVDLICEIAEKQKVDAVWPGWGHASENPELPRRLKDMGITFMGPTAPVMHALGDKIASTILAQSSGVPCIPWNGDGITAEIQSDGSIPEAPFKAACLKNVDEALACAARIKYPVVLKASEGGGGKGIRKCTSDDELRMAWDLVAAEVVGSPVFMMQLATGARHLEVQLVGDEYGDVVALIGRDCSTQRRFQKIFEEGPPTIAPKDAFRKAEQAAQKLAMSVGYRGAGTVEYLFKPGSGEFSFLELNPRLQVEHPVTEALTGVNLPALQLQLGMGIPLSRVPDIRRFYGLNPAETTKIDFINDPYTYPDVHVIAARVTAENPDDAFRPTSGKVERVRFQSYPDVWGYFSIGEKGAIHEFADSQFGHIFAKGPTREAARKTLQLALRNLIIMGDIRNPVEYLVELADTEAFRENTIDTAWLDKLIADKSVNVTFNTAEMVFYAACFRAFHKVKSHRETLLAALGRGHLPMKTDLKLLQAFEVEVAYDGIKYFWQVERTSEDTFGFTIGDTILEARVLEQPDGSLYIQRGKKVQKISGLEEVLGLRLKVEGSATIVFPKIKDPSELRSDFNGKLVRYLHADGDDVEEGKPFAELEAMKMIMSLPATASGKIHHSLSAGSIVSAGQLMGTLDLKDPSNVQTVKLFTGSLGIRGSIKTQKTAEESQFQRQLTGDSLFDGPTKMTSEEVEKIMANCLRGFSLPKDSGLTPTQVVQMLFPAGEEQSADERLASLKATSQLLNVFLDSEQFFASLVGGNETQITSKFTGAAEDLLKSLVAHDGMKASIGLLSTLLQDVASAANASESLPEALVTSLESIAKLPQAGGYGEVKFLASQILDSSKSAPLNVRRKDLRDIIERTERKDLSDLADSDVFEGQSYFGIDLISTLFSDSDPAVRNKAMELYLRRLYRGYIISDVEVVDSKDVVEKTPAAKLHILWTFQEYGVTSGEGKKGYAVIVPDMAAFDALQKSWVMPAATEIGMVHVFVASSPVPESNDPQMHEANVKKQAEDSSKIIKAVGSTFAAKSCKNAFVTLVREEVRPLFLHYSAANGWAECTEYRNMSPVFPKMTELELLAKDLEVKVITTAGRRESAFIGVAKSTKAETLFGRTINYNHMTLQTFEDVVEHGLSRSFDLIERTRLDPMVKESTPAHIFLHFIHPIPGCTERDLKLVGDLWSQASQRLVAAQGPRLLQLKIEKLEVKLWVAAQPNIGLKLLSTSSTGWGTMAFQRATLEAPWTNVQTLEAHSDLSALTPQEELLFKKRRVAQASGSTYIYDFPALFRINLTKMFGDAVPQEELFTATELVLQDGKLEEKVRGMGENKVGMVAWLCKLCTPEYPAGREMVLIGNDITIKAGSFGTDEDDVFQKASELARIRGIPRIYIACNSGARLGTVEELKPLVQVAWVDANDANKGFEYLYLPDDVMKTLPDNAVRSHPITVGGQTRHVIDAIVGLGMASTKGGIGIENLQGSGLIAGETSRAYDETFTLSYVTGRSVGIGAYLNRLGQRNIQMVKGPMILTGYQALNKLLGQQVYTTQDQLGGPHIMVPNGVTHELVFNDHDGVEAILRWLSFVPRNTQSVPPMLSLPGDNVNRKITFLPTKTPYDPRHMLAGVNVDGEWKSGFCDEGSFHEYMEGWGKTVVVGRGRVGGLPIGIIAVETRSVERHVPADPADLTSHDIKEAQAGQVWFPDSAFKTAQAIRDFNRGENLPLIIFANWRGFSGGTRDMFAEVLKYGAMIVDALVEYKHPVTIYIPPNGELRGGAWVVLDPKINPDQMEMFADVEARGGILEPPAASEIVFKQDNHVLTMMHRCDDKLSGLDKQKEAGKDVAKDIKAREQLLLPMYRQVAIAYCDLHDRSGRMKGLGAIHEELNWPETRSYLHWRIRRRLRESAVCKKLRADNSSLSHEEAMAKVKDLLPETVTDDKAVAEWLETHESEVTERLSDEKESGTEKQIFDLIQELPAERRAEVIRDLVGFARITGKSK